MAKTLAELRSMVKHKTNFEGSNFISDENYNIEINIAIAELYETLVAKSEDYYIKSTTLTPSAGKLTLPSDFFKLKGLETLDGVILNRFQWDHRDTNNEFATNCSSDITYRVMGNFIYLNPEETIEQLKLWYVPNCSELTTDVSTLDVELNRWFEFVVVTAAIACLTKEESNTNDLEKRKQDILGRINFAAAERDTTGSETITVKRYKSI